MSGTIFTIGHGDQPLDDVFENLTRWDVTALVDVRSYPYSRRNPQFNESSLEGASSVQGLRYRWMPVLGGRPKDRSLIAEDGSPDYIAMGQTEEFADGISELTHLAVLEQAAILCSESDPDKCHRALLVAPALVDAGWQVRHLLRDGSCRQDVPVARRLL